MADKERRREGVAAGLQGYDQQALMSLYGMYGLGSGYPPGYPALPPPPATSAAPPTTDTLGVAASQAASLNWWGMANQLATQDYLSRLQQAARDPAQFAALQAQGANPGYDLAALSKGKAREAGEVVVSSEGLRLPRDTEIVRTSAPSMAERRRSQDAFPRASPLPQLPAGLTIEKKKPGRKPLEANYHVPSSGNIIDRVEITKIPVAGTNGSYAGLDLSARPKEREEDCAPLNLSMRSDDGDGEPPAQTVREPRRESTFPAALPTFPATSQPLPSDYYASQALSGVFLAEQIRQQQLASELQSHLRAAPGGLGVPGGLGAMQALLGMGQAKQNGKAEGNKGISKNLGRGNQTTKPKKNTVASLLAQTRRDSDKGLASSHPELTIEPIFRSTPSQSPSAAEEDFDQSLGGRRISTYYDSDGRLGIKSVSESPEMNNMRGERGSSEDREEHGSEADCGEGTPGKGKRHYATEDDDLQAPMDNGWRRETSIREYTKSGIRGEVVYVAPCGKKFKQYPDIIRYLEKRGVTNIKRENFSFSTKLIVGDFLRPSGQMDEISGEEKMQRYTEHEFSEEIDRIRKENGWKPRKRNKQTSSTSSRKSNGALSSLESMGGTVQEQYQFLQRLQAEAVEREKRKREDQQQVKLQKEAMRILKEAEKRDKLDMAKRERELKHQQFVEEKKRKQDEISRQKQEEKMKKMHEVEVKRQQAAIYKEQERERRRQHMLLLKGLDAKKKGDERKKSVEALKSQREKEKERRTETRRMEVEIMAELRRPVEDMTMLEEAKPLPHLNRIDNLRLSGEAMANVLMIFEFLHNFGETLGFDMESLPNMTSFQAALLNEDPDSEEELLSVISHLVVCAIEDPGVPNPKTTLTILGQNLRQADITNTNLSEILRIFICARATFEIKLFQGVSPPEFKDRKEAVLGLFHNADSTYMELLEANKTYQLAQTMKDKPFLCLNATQKSEILAFLCNELLNNKSVVNQIEVTMENVHIMKRKKLALENKVKKLRILHNRKFRYKADISRFLEDNNTNASGSMVESEGQSETGDDIDDTKSVLSDRITDSGTDTPTGRAKGKKKNKKPPKSKKKADFGEEGDEDENQSDIELSDVDDEKEEDEEDAHLSAEEMQKKIERLTKLTKKKSEDHTFVNNTLRGTDLGQDRYRRRYWHLAHAGGIFVEGLESAEPWKLATRGLIGTEGLVEEPPTKRLKLDPEAVEIKAEGDNKENIKSKADASPIKSEQDRNRMATEEALRKLGSEILVTPRADPPKSVEAARFTPRITPNGDRLNLFNHSQYFNMSLSPVILNGSVTITPKDGTSSPFYSGLSVPREAEKPWFNLMARAESPPQEVKVEEGEELGLFHPGRRSYNEDLGHASQIGLLEQKLDIVRQMNHESSRVAIPVEQCHGWWKVPDEAKVGEMENCLLQKGTREQNLVINIRKGIEAILESTKKVAPEEINFLEEEPEEDVEGVAKAPRNEVMPGLPAPDAPNSWSQDVALRSEKYLLEQVEALEDKVASASMQVPGWKIPDKPLVDSLSFRPSCLAMEGDEDTRQNAVVVAKQRLLELENAIERRYLKAPLGQSKDATLKNISDETQRQQDKDEAMEVDDEEEEEDDVKENGLERDGKPDEEVDKAEETNGESGDKEEDKKDEDKKDKKKSGVSRGLQTWRDAVKMASNASQLAMAFYILETSIAWDKSIMKASCQFCHGGDNENALLLCDSCDKGYHTYCFKPAITIIPEGDWYCYECINKATGAHHCLVCGHQESKAGLIYCSTCPRAYHTSCIQPAMAKVRQVKVVHYPEGRAETDTQNHSCPPLLVS